MKFGNLRNGLGHAPLSTPIYCKAKALTMLEKQFANLSLSCEHSEVDELSTEVHLNGLKLEMQILGPSLQGHPYL